MIRPDGCACSEGSQEAGEMEHQEHCEVLCRECQVLHPGKNNLMFLYCFGADQLESSLAEKFPGVLVGAKFTVSSGVPLQQGRPTAYWDSLEECCQHYDGG